MIEHYLSQFEICISNKDLKLGRVLHSLLLKSALNLHTILSNRLIHMYSKCNSLPCSISSFQDLPFKNPHSWNTLLAAYSCDPNFIPAALQLFDEMPQPNLVTYNTIISKLSHHGRHKEALKLFSQMQRNGLGMDKFTLVAVAPACAGLSDLHSLRRLHSAIISNGFILNCIMSNVIVDGYGKCGDVNSARQVFDQMLVKDIVSWTSLITAYTSGNQLDDARRVFIRAPSRSAVSWTALISGFEQNGREDDAVDLFEQMVEEGMCPPTPYTLVSLLSACARLGLMDRGKQVHCYMLRRSFNIFAQNSLVDMYAKCGVMESASAIFDSMPVRDIVSWNSMVTGFAQNGLAKESFVVFERMLKAGITPTHVTFLGVLSACSHAGLVTVVHQILRFMEKEFKVCPGTDHYSVLIDALGRMRRLEEAMKVIEDYLDSNGGSSSVGMWGALLGACQVHGNVEFGRRAAESLFVLEPENGARYVTLSNIYASRGKWDEARKVRFVMKGKGLRKEAGCSWIEVKGGKKVFVPQDNSHSQTLEIYEMLSVLVYQMKEET